MHFEKLKTFMTVADLESFSEAARVLYLSQPTITSQIKSLEKEMNTLLFDRTTKQLQMTKAAVVLYNYGLEIINLTEKAKKEINLISNSGNGQLIFGCSLTIGENLLPLIFTRYKSENPYVSISVDVMNTSKIKSKIKENSLDLGLTEAPIDDPDIYIEPFMDDELLLVANPTFFNSEKKEVEVSELRNMPLILREKGSGTRNVMELHLSKAGINPAFLNVSLELGSTEAVKSSVEAGIGATILSKNAINKELKLQTLKTFSITGLKLYRKFYIAYNRKAVLSTHTTNFIKAIQDLSKTDQLNLIS